jgi:hypothetical protein
MPDPLAVGEVLQRFSFTMLGVVLLLLLTLAVLIVARVSGIADGLLCCRGRG